MGMVGLLVTLLHLTQVCKIFLINCRDFTIQYFSRRKNEVDLRQCDDFLDENVRSNYERKGDF